MQMPVVNKYNASSLYEIEDCSLQFSTLKSSLSVALLLVLRKSIIQVSASSQLELEEAEMMQRMKAEAAQAEAEDLRRRERNQEVRSHLASLQLNQSITRPWVYSYFVHWPRDLFEKWEKIFNNFVFHGTQLLSNQQISVQFPSLHVCILLNIMPLSFLCRPMGGGSAKQKKFRFPPPKSAAKKKEALPPLWCKGVLCPYFPGYERNFLTSILCNSFSFFSRDVRCILLTIDSFFNRT